MVAGTEQTGATNVASAFNTQTGHMNNLLRNATEAWLAACDYAEVLKTTGAYIEAGYTWERYVDEHLNIKYPTLRAWLAWRETGVLLQDITQEFPSQNEARKVKAWFNDSCKTHAERTNPDLLEAVVRLAYDSDRYRADNDAIEDAPPELSKHGITAAFEVYRECQQTGAVTVNGESVEATEENMILATAEATAERIARQKAYYRKTVKGRFQNGAIVPTEDMSGIEEGMDVTIVYSAKRG